MSCFCSGKISKASSRNRLVTLKKIVRSADSMGGETITYTKIRDLWANFKDKSAKESYNFHKINEEVDSYIICDYNDVSDLVLASDRSEWIIEYNSVSYNILYIINVEEQDMDVNIYLKRGARI